MARIPLSALCVAFVLHGSAPLAAPLEKEECAKLKDEQGALEAQGVRANLAKGPEWGKANLQADKLEQVRRLIDVDEQLVFRCAGKPLWALPANAEPGAEQSSEAEGAHPDRAPGRSNSARKTDGKSHRKAGAQQTDATAPAAARSTTSKGQGKGQGVNSAPVRRKPAQAKATPGHEAAQGQDQDQGQAQATTEPRGKKKPKVDDAYRPQPAGQDLLPEAPAGAKQP